MSKPGAGIESLTPSQLLATGSPHRLVYVEAAPGSGKTTVSALRFGLHRFATTADQRAVVAVSFTRSATEELRNRVVRHWGPSAVSWPHRIVTLDTLLCDLLSHLLKEKILQWPQGHTDLDVLDTWRTALPLKYGRIKPVLKVSEHRQVVIRTIDEQKPGSHPSAPDFKNAILEGRCTHDNVREVLQEALRINEARAALTSYFRNTMRSLTVDEVFDANDLDREILSIATPGCRSLTLVGDPWQALYQFRGARPAAMKTFIHANKFTTHTLHESFRWGSEEQAFLTGRLRQRITVYLTPGSPHVADVVIAHKWQSLWDAHSHVLPLAIKTRVGKVQEAICTLLLNEITQRALGLQAVFLHDALSTLGLDIDDLATRLRPCLRVAVSQLTDGHPPRQVWQNLSGQLADLNLAVPPQRYARAPLADLARLQTRLADDRLVPGLTCHQSKGREWDTVAIKLSVADASALAQGLDPDDADHRALYVALTRARLRTVAL
ncbi:UvrD-helicase domain-containing protein [Streptomyces sp. NPDC002130]|uniref:UvrD-helicase domain-containing protein n=1 Tax=Streptomyces sp. NPDC002130 TaxID=3155568 RepID=UPI003331C198